MAVEGTLTETSPLGHLKQLLGKASRYTKWFRIFKFASLGR